MHAGTISQDAHSSVANKGAVTYGDVFSVTGPLATRPITKEDAVLMQHAETLKFGHTQKGGTTATMQSAADRNVQAQAAAGKDGTCGDVLSITSTPEKQPMTKDDASLMQHAEMLTFGRTQKGGTAAMMQSVADQKMQACGDANNSTANKGVTYGDVFPVTGELATQPITKEDATLMQRAETFILGQTQKGGAAAKMQSAADHNVQVRAIPEDTHSSVGDEGVSVVTTILPKDVVHAQFVAGQPISSSSALPTRTTVPAVAANLQDTVTIGEALEAVALRAGDEPVKPSDASAIQSAEKRATRGIATQPGSLAATAQAAAELNPRVQDFAKTTLSDVLMDASVMLPCDKVVTWEDAEKVAGVELRNNQTTALRDGGVAATLVAAAELNERGGLAPSSEMEQLKVE